ncbi:WD40 repeat domain-containing protein [Kutzneria sp. CA-103260]|uniref:WD40 repeat domain-containing protein n=1 Tax=Kutzneria sp. CA-103260 TaxID=2802641 RepID=UPI002011E257|nr:WD40 repeat domain-containing protein [Kutzneria sp. CA-103260]
MADVAAAIRHTPKDLLVGEHIRQHRRTMRLARGGVTTLAILLVIAVVAALIAVSQRNNAQNQARVATARQLAALAVSDLSNHFDLAQLYAVAAYRMDDDAQTRSALFQAVTASPHLVRMLPIGAQMGVVAGASTARVVVAGTNDGRLLRWDLDHDAISQVRVGTAKITGIAVDGTGRRIVASDASKIFIWNGDNGAQPVVLPIPQVLPSDSLPQQHKLLAISPSGNTIAAIQQSASGDGKLLVLDGATGHVLRSTAADPAWFAIGLPDDTTLNTANGAGSWSHLSVASLTVTDSGAQLGTPSDAYYCCGFSADAGYSVWAKYDTVNVIADQTSPPAGSSNSPNPTAAVPLAYPDRFAVSTDGKEVAVSGGGALYVASTSGDSENPAQQLSGTGNVDAITFVGGSHQLVSASGSTLMFWDLDQTSRVTTGPAVDATDTSNAGDQPLISVSPDGTHIALSGDYTDSPLTSSKGNFVVENVGASPPAVMVTAPFTDAVPVWSPDGSRLLLIGSASDAGYSAVQWSAGQFQGAWHTPNANTPVAARVSPDGQRVVVVSDHGDIQVRRMSDGAVLTSVGGGQQQIGANSFGTRNYAAISADLTTVYLVGSDSVVHVVDTATGQQHALPGSAALSVAAADDRLLVTRSDNSLEVWNTAGTQLVRTIPADAGYTPVITAIPGGRLVARLNDLGTVELWNSDTGAALGSFPLPFPIRSTGQPAWDSTAVAASQDGRELVSASADGAIVRWQLDPGAWVRLACATAGRDLTVDEWRGQVNDSPPDDLACRQ